MVLGARKGRKSSKVTLMKEEKKMTSRVLKFPESYIRANISEKNGKIFETKKVLLQEEIY